MQTSSLHPRQIIARKLREVLDQPNLPKPDPVQKTFGFTNLSDEAKTPGN